ncbi:hypothetical protein HZH68_004249 [Vespula germanica]|uniref:Uncharacterized protein n=1 Tax=Vespula germanica TaxID=30212 RepID=A0A834KNF1_VESGE|nr:hypothetical protein HZH68_004249 [Vespula germanica]
MASKPPSEIARCPSDFINVSSESHIPQSAFRGNLRAQRVYSEGGLRLGSQKTKNSSSIRQVDRFGDEAEVTARQCVEIYDCHCVLSASGSYSVECNRQTVDTLGSQERRDETPRTRVVDQGATPRAVLTLL